MIFEEKLISSERIYDGAILNVRRDKVTAFSGEAYREIIEHNGAVAMVAVTDQGNIVLVRQYRYAFGKALLEIPAGKIDEGETDPAKTAARELTEEAMEVIEMPYEEFLDMAAGGELVDMKTLAALLMADKKLKGGK